MYLNLKKTNQTKQKKNKKQPTMHYKVSVQCDAMGQILKSLLRPLFKAIGDFLLI